MHLDQDRGEQIIRVLVVDNTRIHAQLLADALKRDPSLQVVGAVSHSGDLIDIVRQQKIDVAVIGCNLDEQALHGIEVLRQLKSTWSGIQAIVLLDSSKRDVVIEAFRAGASGYVLKRSAASELSEAIKQVMNGNTYVSPLLTKDVLSILLGPRTPVLTGRQREILRCVAQGLSAKEIANLLNISVKTAHFHKTSIMEKLHIHTTAELTKYALEHGIAS